MKTEEIANEKNNNSCCKNKSHALESMTKTDLLTISNEYLKKNDAAYAKFNLNSSFSSMCLDRITQEEDMHAARERIRKRQKDCITFKNRLI